MNLEQLKDNLAAQLFKDEDERARFDAASNHPYECKCELCKEWWEKMGPEEE